MASQKLLLFFALIAICAAFVNADDPKKFILKTLIVGYRERNDRLIQREVIKKQGAFLSFVKYAKTYVGNNHSIITQIRLIDLNTNGKGAIPKVITGGPGDSFVTLSFRSLLNHGINFNVEIYGKEPAKEE